MMYTRTAGIFRQRMLFEVGGNADLVSYSLFTISVKVIVFGGRHVQNLANQYQAQS